MESNSNSFLETIKLFWLNLVIKKRNFIEHLRVIYRFYFQSKFRKIDLSLLFLYLGNSPFQISKKFLIHQGEKEVYAYGETPLTTLQKIVAECHITADDTVFELGSGRGRSCFWLNCFVGCPVVGIDFVPEFIQKANIVKKKFHLDQIAFREENFLQTNYSGATVIYLYGTLLEEPFLKRLIKKFRKLPTGTKVITVSYSLLDYTEESLFTLLKTFPVSFNWGETDAYLHVRNL